jgi:hypothetical protein
MTFNINEFKSTVNKYGGPARKNLFVLEIASPPVGNTGMRTNDLKFFCQTVDTPGLNFAVSDYYPNSFGIRQSIPTAMSYDQFNCIFMLDSDHTVLSFFHQWMQSVLNYNYSNGPFSQINGQLPFEVGYKDEISTTITVKHYSTDSQSTYYEYVLNDAFPTQISGAQLSWADNDSYSTATVNFAYSNMSVSGMKKGTPTERFSRGTGLIDIINRIGAAAQLINQSSVPTSIQSAIDEVNRANLAIQNFNSGFSQIRTGLNAIGNIFR